MHYRHKRRPCCVVLLLAVCLLVPSPALGQVPDEYMVEMRDGTRLATDVYTSILPTSFPAVVMRTPYGKSDSLVQSIASLLVFGGYTAVVQDMRGTGGSEGEASLFESDGWGVLQDGYDTIEWAASQPWCDGQVGMFGVSALGINAYLAAGARPPSLVCEVVMFAASDLYDQAAYQGGALRASLIDGWLGAQNPALIQRVLDNSTRSEIWDILDVEDRQPLIRVPTLHIGGWYDCFLQGTVNHYAGLQSRGDVGASGNQKMIVGPWTHGEFLNQEQGELIYPPNSIYPELLADSLAWFDYWLKGEANGVMDGPRVRYYLMGDVDDPSAPGNEWRESHIWPPFTTHEERLFLWDGGALRGWRAEGDAAIPEQFTYDPSDPVPTLGGTNLEIDAGPYDQRPVESRSDVLVYTSDELTTPLEITGRIRVELYASSSAVDTDWTAKLCDVYPDGRSMLVCDGILQARYRESTSTPTLMTPDTVYRFVIDLWSTSLVFDTGHRIRVAISSSNAPRFEPNPNNGRPVRSGDPPVVATNTVYHDSVRRSALVLPVTWPLPGKHPFFWPLTAASHWGLYR